MTPLLVWISMAISLIDWFRGVKSAETDAANQTVSSKDSLEGI